MDVNTIGKAVWNVIGKTIQPRKVVELCVICGQHPANPTQYFEDQMLVWCDEHQQDFNLSELEAELERLEDLMYYESIAMEAK